MRESKRDEFGLLPCERKVVDCLVLGLGTAEIMEKLDLTRSTVYEYVKRSLKATGTNHRGALIAKVANRG